MEALHPMRGIAAPTTETSSRPRLVYSVWLRIGFVGASVVAACIADFASGAARGQGTGALIALLAGVVLLALGWRNGTSALAAMAADGTDAEAHFSARLRVDRAPAGA
jgi:hypothetical protein